MLLKVITIDGPAAAGKTTLARNLSKVFGFGVLNSGALYRAATWVMRREQLHEAGAQELCSVLESADLKYQEDSGQARLWCGREEITDQLNDPDLTREIKLVADQPEVRRWMNRWQREICSGQQWKIAEGRDQGTEVFPDAPVKFFLTASQETRVHRRKTQFEGQGKAVDPKELEADMISRDQADQNRPMGALRVPPGAVTLDSSQLDADQVLNTAREWVERCLKDGEGGLPSTLS